MKVKLKAKVIYEWEYEADSKDYGDFGNTVEIMIQCDIDGIKSDPFLTLEALTPEIIIKKQEAKP